MPWITLLFKASGELRLFDGIRGENRRPFHRHSGIGLQTLPYPSRKCELGTARMSEAEEGGFAGDFRIQCSFGFGGVSPSPSIVMQFLLVAIPTRLSSHSGISCYSMLLSRFVRRNSIVWGQKAPLIVPV